MVGKVFKNPQTELLAGSFRAEKYAKSSIYCRRIFCIYCFDMVGWSARRKYLFFVTEGLQLALDGEVTLDW